MHIRVKENSSARKMKILMYIMYFIMVIIAKYNYSIYNMFLTLHSINS